MIGAQALALRLTAGSEEAGYLAQIFPIPKTPTVVILKHGELKEYISSGTSKPDFIRRVRSAFNAAPQEESTPSEEPSTTADSVTSGAQASSTGSTEATEAASSPAATQSSESVSRVLAERAAKLKQQKEEAELKAKENRLKAKERAKAEAEAGAKTDAARKHQQAEEVKKKRVKESEERQRILRRIQDDKEERRLRASEREQQRINGQKVGDVAASLVSAPASKMPSTTRTSDIASLQVRLFDGSTIRSRFKTATSLKDVRTWVDENTGDKKLPYTFKQVLTPLPNKNIDATEENQSLGDLGLVPSSTLVLIPVKKYTSAYEGESQDVVSQFLRALTSFFTWFLGLLGLAAGNGTRRQPLPVEAAGDASEPSQDANRRIRGFQNPTDQLRDHQLYNGNSVSYFCRIEPFDHETSR